MSWWNYGGNKFLYTVKYKTWVNLWWNWHWVSEFQNASVTVLVLDCKVRHKDAWIGVICVPKSAQKHASILWTKL